MLKSWGFKERRQHQRIQRSFVIDYYEKDGSPGKQESTQIKNIGLGGICFVTPCGYKKGEKLAIDLKTPYLTDSIHLEGTVLESTEKIKNMIYETRLVFDSLSQEAEFIVQKMVSAGIKSE